MFYTFSEPSTVTGLDDFYLLFRGSLKKIIIYIYVLNFIGSKVKRLVQKYNLYYCILYWYSLSKIPLLKFICKILVDTVK